MEINLLLIFKRAAAIERCLKTKYVKVELVVIVYSCLKINIVRIRFARKDVALSYPAMYIIMVFRCSWCCIVLIYIVIRCFEPSST